MPTRPVLWFGHEPEPTVHVGQPCASAALPASGARTAQDWAALRAIHLRYERDYRDYMLRLGRAMLLRCRAPPAKT